MNNLNNVQWGEVRLSDIFKTISRGKVSDLHNVDSGKYAIIAAAGVNEGLSCFSNISPCARNAMTISFNGVGTGTAFVHNYPFNLNSDCGLVKPIENLKIEVLQFIAVAINKNKDKFSYGYKANENRLLRQKVMLPITEAGKPDYDFMERYVKELKESKRAEYINYAKRQLSRIRLEKTDRLTEWQPYDIKSVCNIHASSSSIDKQKLKTDQSEETTPYVTRSDVNNGIQFFIGEQPRPHDEANAITIGLDTQTVFYQPYCFYTGQNIQVLENKELTRENALFMIPLLKIQMQKFNWGGNGATLGRLKRTKIMLPTKNGKPDYDYMSNNMKEIIAKRYQEYIDYSTKAGLKTGT